MQKRNGSTRCQLNDLYANDSPELVFSANSLAEMDDWRVALRARTRSLLGLDVLRSEGLVPPRARVVERIEEETLIREKVLVQTQPDMWVPAWVLIPRHVEPPYPTLLCLHGHGMSKEVVIGHPRTAYEREALRKYNGDYGRQFAERGYLCFCPDTRGFGERSDIERGDCDRLYRQALMMGQVLAGLRVWDHLRAVDYLAARSDVDAERMGVVGLSMGGEHAMYVAALDERIRAAVISCAMRHLKPEFLRDPSAFCICLCIPGLFALADWPDIGALIAPRPLFIEQGLQDRVPMEAVRSGVTTLRRAYALCGAASRLDSDYFAGEHAFSGRKAMPWMDHWLDGGPAMESLDKPRSSS